MSKVITFSRTFPAYHPKKGQPTYFVEKFWESYQQTESDISKVLTPLTPYIQEYKASNDFNYIKYGAKNHTIRGGNRWKVGDYFSPRVWSGKPYNSPQIKIAPDTLIVKVWDFEIDENGVYSIDGYYTDNVTDELLAKNDGLNEMDLQHWFIPNYNKWNKKFKGQIICWNESVNY